MPSGNNPIAFNKYIIIKPAVIYATNSVFESNHYFLQKTDGGHTAPNVAEFSWHFPGHFHLKWDGVATSV